MGKYYWQCTANPAHKSADWRDGVFLHWNTKYCVQCSAPMLDVRPQWEKDRNLAKAEQLKKQGGW